MCRAILFFGLLGLSCANAARILFVSGTPLRSHQLVFQPIWRELSLRGHQVTVVTSEPLRDPSLTNLTELSMAFVYQKLEEQLNYTDTLFGLKDDRDEYRSFFVRALTIANQEYLSRREVQKVIQWEGSKFDLVMVEYLLPAFLALGPRFKCPIIALSAHDASLVGHNAIGNPSHVALNPDFLQRFNLPLTFWQRLWSLHDYVIDLMYQRLLHQYEDNVVMRYFSAGYKKLTKIAGDIDMFFMNVNPAFQNVRPTVPAVVHIGGGIHVTSPQVLPEDLKTFLDEASEGAIYVNFGAIVKAKNLTPQFWQPWLKTLSELPYRVLWRMDGEIPGKPENVLVQDWVPQQDVLRHQNVRLFVNPGSLLAIEEAIVGRVPLLLTPYCCDHFSNAVLVEKKGFGLGVEFNRTEEDVLKRTITELIINSKYKKGVNKMADLTRDQPMTGLEKAIWWTEYVLRHKGAKHLRSPAVDMPFWQYFLLDVVAVLVLAITIVVYLIYKLLAELCRFLCKSKNSKKIKAN